MKSKIELIRSICKYCIKEYQILNNGPLISNFIYQLCREIDIVVPSVRGIVSVEIEGYKRQFAHCFNIYNSNIIDATIYQHALMNKSIENLFPIFVAGVVPENIEYIIYEEIKLDSQIKFKRDYLKKVLDEVYLNEDITLSKFNIIEDSKKKSLFYYK